MIPVLVSTFAAAMSKQLRTYIEACITQAFASNPEPMDLPAIVKYVQEMTNQRDQVDESDVAEILQRMETRMKPVFSTFHSASGPLYRPIPAAGNA